MTLDMVNCGEKIEIIKIKDANIRAQAIRLGISEGSKLVCAEKLTSGPIILLSRTQEVAIGRRLAQEIGVKKVC